MELEKEYKNIFQYCMYRTGNKEDSEDITQETFLRYLQHPEYHKKGQERQFLYKIAKNLCIDRVRKNCADPLDETRVSDNSENVVQHVSLRIALSELSDEEREIIILRYLNGESISVIAGLYNTSRFSMGRKIRAITQKLRNKLGKEDVF